MSGKERSFVGRGKELCLLNEFMRKRKASLIVIRGRRRIGKSRLVEEFAKEAKFFSFAGLAPTAQTTAQSQRDVFSQQLSEQTTLPDIKADDWSKLFQLLSERVEQGRIVLLFDEISWMGSKDPDFLGKIKHAWDQKFKQNPELIFVICGSASAWIEKNILNSTGFLGRVSYTLTLEELPLQDCQHFWGKQANNISAYEKFKLLAVTGGVPRYLEELNPSISAEENIASLCFRKGSILVSEFEHIFSNMFSRRTSLYRLIVSALAEKSRSVAEIAVAAKTEINGLFSEYLEELSLCGFIKRDFTWNLRTGMDSRLSQYRLSDNYLRFYLRYIDKYKDKIERGSFEFTSLSALPAWRTLLGLQFENLVLNNRRFIQVLLGIRPEDIISDNPFFQHTTTKQAGCQIDYMIQTKFDTLYVCEIKFSANPIGVGVARDVQQKITRLVRPKGTSCRPILIHVNGVTDELVREEYFADMIDFGELLES